MLVEALVPELPVEALDEAVLLRLARVDEVQPHTAFVGPLVERPARQLRLVVQDDGIRDGAPLFSQAVKHADHALARERGVAASALGPSGAGRVVVASIVQWEDEDV